MKHWFQSLKVAHKLMLISFFFVLPDSLMLYLFIDAINDNIEFASMEAKGNRYQRPLEDLLELIPQHAQLSRRASDGGPASHEALERKAREIDAAFAKLNEVDSQIGADLQFTDEGLAKRSREQFRVRTLQQEWEAMKSGPSVLDDAAMAEKHLKLVAAVRVMITHAGDTSNLILDPDLDSYYLMDATLLALPQAQDRIGMVMTHGEMVLKRPAVTEKDRREFAVFVNMLEEQDLERIVASIQTSLREDRNFYGTSEGLQARVPPALEQYVTASNAFNGLTKKFVELETPDVTIEEFLAAGKKARDASFNLWRIACDEMDGLLNARIAAYQGRRTRSLLVAACALVAAIGFVTFITRSISGPLRKQTAALQNANEALKAEIAERNRMEIAVRAAEEKYRGIFENSVEGIFQSTKEGRYIEANPTLARIYGYDSVPDLMTTMTDIGARLYVDPRRRGEFQRRIALAGTVRHFESQVYRKDGSIIWISENVRAVNTSYGRLDYYEGTVEDISERKEYEAELEMLNKKLVDTSRKAGMAEVATGVLHNVGNVLNSVNVSAMLVVDRLRKSRIAHLGNVSAMLREHSTDLGAFLTSDPKGMKLPAFIGSLAERLGEEQGELLKELDGLSRNVAHIKEIVSVQQKYAKVSGVIESLPAALLVEDALEMNGAAFDRHGVEVIRDFAEVPPVRVDKHKVLQILINLIRNAKYALSECARLDKQMTVRIGTNENGRVIITVADNGIGIAKDNLARIFGHGFTTKKDGHGFGLHSSALAASENGGSLTAHSDGPGRGATFVLELPLDKISSAAPSTAALVQ